MVVDSLAGCVQFEARLADEARLVTLFPLQAFLLEQEGESVEEREGVVGGGLFGLLSEGLCHTGQSVRCRIQGQTSIKTITV